MAVVSVAVVMVVRLCSSKDRDGRCCGGGGGMPPTLAVGYVPAAGHPGRRGGADDGSCGHVAVARLQHPPGTATTAGGGGGAAPVSV